jgi:LEA14-like dessication related protein
MNKQKQILILVIILIVAAVVWFLYLRAGTPVETPPVQPVAEDTGKFVPKLNNTLETSVTVVNPNELPPGQPTQ